MQQKMASNKLGDVILSIEDGVGVDKIWNPLHPCSRFAIFTKLIPVLRNL
jgi:hypothetical protein